jgi:hypothetical protein
MMLVSLLACVRELLAVVICDEVVIGDVLHAVAVRVCLPACLML